MSAWAKIPTEDYEYILREPDSPEAASTHLEHVQRVYSGPYMAALFIWKKLPEKQWETTRAIGRDMPEWKDLMEVLLAFKKELHRIRKVPKKLKEAPNAIETIVNPEDNAESVPQLSGN